MAKQFVLPRSWCSELVSLRMISGDRIESLCGNLEEIGQRTALVLADSPVGIETKVNIVCKSHILRGITKACQRDQGLGYFIEIELTPTSSWSPQWFAPEHLFATPG